MYKQVSHKQEQCSLVNGAESKSVEEYSELMVQLPHDDAQIKARPIQLITKTIIMRFTKKAVG
eukprot:6960195-Pyramimonas_sp.AAC.1